MIKEAKGFGETIDEAKENALKNLNASDFDDIQFDVLATPKKKVLGLFGGNLAEVRAYIEIPDKKGAGKKGSKNSGKKSKETAGKPEKTKQSAEVKKAEKVNPANDDLIDADTVDKNSNLGKAVDYVKTVLAFFECDDATIKVAPGENSSFMLIEGESAGSLVGRHGETLDALQYLTNLAANNGGGHSKVSINIGNYREKRAEALASLAKRIADQCLKTGKCRTLEPMNPYERRIIHTTIQAIEGVKSASFGEGTQRRVVVAPENSEFRPRTNGGRQRTNRSSYKKPQSSATGSDNAKHEPMKDSDLPLYGKIN